MSLKNQIPKRFNKSLFPLISGVLEKSGMVERKVSTLKTKYEHDIPLQRTNIDNPKNTDRKHRDGAQHLGHNTSKDQKTINQCFRKYISYKMVEQDDQHRIPVKEMEEPNSIIGTHDNHQLTTSRSNKTNRSLDKSISVFMEHITTISLPRADPIKQIGLSTKVYRYSSKPEW
jgi:hypothetical protein